MPTMRPKRSSKPRLSGVPVTAQRCCASSLSAISAAFAVELSTICASSRQTRHQRSRVSGVGTTCKRPEQPAVRRVGAQSRLREMTACRSAL